MSWLVEIRTTQSAPEEFSGNELRFGTEDEALDYGLDTATRWFGLADWRVFESGDPVTHEWKDGQAYALSTS